MVEIDKNTTRIFLVMCFAVIMLFFSIIFSIRFLWVAEDAGCPEKMDSNPVYDSFVSVHTKSMSKIVIESYFENNNLEYDLKYSGEGLVDSGVAFIYSDKVSNVKYAVLETGEVFRYYRDCS